MNSKAGAKMKDIEDNFDGNICRCTGYRPILDAFKSLGTDATEELRRKCGDMEVRWPFISQISPNYKCLTLIGG